MCVYANEVRKQRRGDVGVYVCMLMRMLSDMLAFVCVHVLMYTFILHTHCNMKVCMRACVCVFGWVVGGGGSNSILARSVHYTYV